MARASSDDFGSQADGTDHSIVLDGSSGSTLTVPGNQFITDADMLRDGQDLILRAPDGSEVIVENYFAAEPSPALVSADGAALTPELVDSFVKPVDGIQYAQKGSVDDESPIGMVKETSGEATITHPDGTIIKAAVGAPIYQGDIVETKGDGAVNITFVDDTTFAVSENARLAIDEYVFDPATQSGETNFSVLRGVFVFTSGLIGRDDPDDVQIDTPVGSIGIRGTTIMGTINPNGDSQITVVEGAIVVRNASGEQTLSQQFETVRLAGFDGPISNEGQLSSQQIAESYNVLRSVSAPLFSNIDDAGAEGETSTDGADATVEEAAPEGEPAPVDTAPADGDGTQATDPAKAEDGAQLMPADQPVIADTAADAGFDTGASVDKAPMPVSEPVLATNTFAPPPPPPPGSTVFMPTGTNTTISSSQNPPPPPNVINGGSSGGTTPPPPPGALDLNAFITGSTSNANYIPNPNGFIAAEHGDTVIALGDINHDGTMDFAFTAGNEAYFVINNTMIDVTATYGITDFADMDISSVGDFNGDGFNDIILSAHRDQSNDGTVVLISGQNPSNYMEITGFTGGGSSTYGANLGYSVSGIGDFDGDGLNDFVMSTAPDDGTTAPQVFITYGKLGGITGTLDKSFYGASPNDPDGYYLTGTVNSHYGEQLAGIGDFNHDGFSDLGISRTVGGFGSVTVVHGGLRNAAHPADTVYSNIQLDGPETDVWFFGAGDVNGNGAADFAIAERGTETLHIYYGEGAHPSTVNVGTTPGDLRITTSDATSEIVGAGFAGDFNGDGVDDVAVAMQTGNMVDIYVVYGKPGITGTIDVETLTPAQGFKMALDLSSPDFDLLGNYSSFEISLSTRGDRNADGFDDLMIGLPNIDSDGTAGTHTDSGGIVLVSGGANGSPNINTTQTATGHGQSLIGTSVANIQSDGGFSNISFRGGDGNDIFKASSMQREFNGGVGYDKVEFLTPSTTLDLRLMDENLHGIEWFKMAASQTMKIGLDDIFRLLQESSAKELRFEGDATNALQIDNNGSTATALGSAGFTAAGTAGGYDIFTYGAYTLYVGDNVTTTVSNI